MYTVSSKITMLCMLHTYNKSVTNIHSVEIISPIYVLRERGYAP